MPRWAHSFFLQSAQMRNACVCLGFCHGRRADHQSGGRSCRLIKHGLQLFSRPCRFGGGAASGYDHVHHANAKNEAWLQAGNKPCFQFLPPAGGNVCRAVPPRPKIVKSGARYGAKPGFMRKHRQPAHPSAGHEAIVNALRQRIAKKEPCGCCLRHKLPWVGLTVGKYLCGLEQAYALAQRFRRSQGFKHSHAENQR